MASRTFILLIIALSAIFFILPQKSLATSNIIINEIMYDLPGTDADHEWVELYNAGSSEVDLTDWKFNDGSNHALNQPPKNGGCGSLIINPDGYLILAGNAETLISDLPNYNGSVIDTVMNLPNSAGVLKIIDKNGQEITSASYNKEMGANGNGKTLEWDGNMYKESKTDNGTPGKSNTIIVNTTEQEASQQQNDIAPATPSDETASSTPSVWSNYSDEILINEFMPWPESGNEWIELLNSGKETIDLSGWQIDDTQEGSSPQKISDGTLIDPDQFLVIELEENILNNDGDEIRLIWPDNQLLHSVVYKNARLNLSSSRFENGFWFWTDQPTPDGENKKFAQKISAPLQTENSYVPDEPSLIQQKTAVAATSEPISQKKNESNNNEDIVETIDTSLVEEQNPPPNQIAASQSSAVQQVTVGNSGLNPVIALSAVAALSLLSGIGIVYFKRKKAIDSE